MNFNISKVLAAGVVLLAAMPAQAATCPDPIITGTGIVTVTTDSGTASCLTYGSNNVDLSSYGLVLIDKSTDTSGTMDGALTIAESSTVGIGDFSIGATPGYTSLTLVVKDGNLNGLQWGAFSLSALALSGDWSLQDKDGKFKGLSGGELWGSISAVPVPAAAWLFGTALIGFIGFSRRTKV
jgi:hypothetical protein